MTRHNSNTQIILQRNIGVQCKTEMIILAYIDEIQYEEDASDVMSPAGSIILTFTYTVIHF